MRVLVITNLYPPHHYGGYELGCQAVVERWRADGHDVEVLTSAHRLAGVPDGPDTRVHRGLRFYWAEHELLHPPPWVRLRWERGNRTLLDRVLERHRPDVVSVWNHGTMSYSLLARVLDRGIPLALVVADNWLCWGPHYDLWTRMFDGRGWLGRLAGRVVERVLDIPTTYPDLGERALPLFASSWLQANVQESSQFRFRRQAVVPWGIDPTEFEDPGAPHRAAADFGWRLVFVGRVEERKGVLTAVRALSMLPDASLDLVGPAQPAERATLLALAEELGVGDRVSLREVDHTAVGRCYREADVALFPSEWGEPFGLVGLEAMASGTPLVATGTGGSSDYLRHEVNVLLVAPGDADLLATSIQRLAGDAALRRRLIEGGTTTVRSFTLDRMASGLAAWHEALIDGFARGEPS